MHAFLCPFFFLEPPIIFSFCFSIKSIRQNKEKVLKKENKDIPFPGWDALDKEKNEAGSSIIFVITDVKGNFVTRITSTYKKGFNRVSWNLKVPIVTSLNGDRISENPSESRSSVFVPSGTYIITMYANNKGDVTPLSQPQSFEVEAIFTNVLNNEMQGSINSYLEELKVFKTEVDVTLNNFRKASKRLSALEKALVYVSSKPGPIEKEISNLKKIMQSIELKLSGNSSKDEIGEKDIQSISSRLSLAQSGFSTSYGPTRMHMESLSNAKLLFQRLQPQVDKFLSIQIPAFEKLLIDAKVPLVFE